MGGADNGLKQEKKDLKAILDYFGGIRRAHLVGSSTLVT